MSNTRTSAAAASPSPVDAARATALVTGAGGGIGRAIALGLADAGFDVALVDLKAGDALAETLDEVERRGARGVALSGDLADVATHGPMLDEAERALGPLACLVNNAGVTVLTRGDLLDVSPQAFDHCLTVNTRGTFFLTQAFARRLLGRPGARAHRSIVTITSSNAQAASVERAEYCVSKAALSMVTALFAVRLGAAGIGVYEVVPGLIDTPMSAASRTRYDADIARGWLVQPRWGRPDEVARVVTTLAQGLLPYTVGQRIHVDGGMLIPKD